MAMTWKTPGIFAGLLLASGCVAYPYETAFSSCDGEAGICYRYCEEFADTPEYASCHAACDEEANQCFAGAYDAYRYSGAQYTARYSPYPSPWYGRYGSWYPNRGYSFSFDYYGRGYGNGRRPRNPYYGYGGGGRRQPGNPPSGGSGSSGSGQPAPPPPQAQPPQSPQAQPPANAGKTPPRRRQPRRTPRTKDNPVRDED